MKKKHILYTTALCGLSLWALSACSDDVVGQEIDNTGKSPIELSASNRGSFSDGNLTRASIIEGNGKVTAFEKHTRLSLLMISDDNATDHNSNSLYTVTYALAKGEGKKDNGDLHDDKKSDVSFEASKTATQQLYTDPTGESNEQANNIADNDGSWRYWDDAHARSSHLSIYGFAVNNTILPCGAPWSQTINGKSSTANNGWETFTESGFSYKIGGTNIPWTIGDQTRQNSYKCQSFLSLLYKDDVCYSNNISGNSKLKFNTDQSAPETYHKFDKGEMQFNHAMAMLSFKIVPGEGFNISSSTNFNFKSGTNVALKGFYKKGYLNIKTGEWESVVLGDDASYNNNSGYSWNKIGSTTGNKTIDQITDHSYYLLSVVIPGTDIKNSTIEDAVTFIIDGNEYKLSMKQLYDALIANRTNWPSNYSNESDVFDKNTSDEYVCLKAGINYEFTFTVGKTKIDHIKASLVDWVTVNAEASPDNAVPLTVTMEQNAGSQTPVASYLYKSAVTSATTTGNDKGYSNDVRFELAANTGAQNTGWYWESNSTYYNFRTIAPKESLTVDGTSDANYITMTGDDVASAKDYVWGAPLKETHTGTPTSHSITYDFSKGYGDFVYPAIGPTNNDIHITQFHMMTDLEVKLQTTTGDDAVTLTGASVKLVNYANKANLMVGKGLVSGWTDIKTTAQALTPITDGSDYTWRTVPQHLSRGTNAADKVGLIITLTDGNIYEIKDLSTLPVKVNGATTASYITFWEPGKKYVYNLTLKKTAIDRIEATVVDWETVTASYDDVKIQ